VSVLSVKITIFCSGLLCLSKKSGNFSKYILEDKKEELMELLARESLTDPSIITVTTEDFEAGFVAGVKRHNCH
jgi:chorismate mutase